MDKLLLEELDINTQIVVLEFRRLESARERENNDSNIAASLRMLRSAMTRFNRVARLVEFEIEGRKSAGLKDE